MVMFLELKKSKDSCSHNNFVSVTYRQICLRVATLQLQYNYPCPSKWTNLLGKQDNQLERGEAAAYQQNFNNFAHNWKICALSK